MFNLVAFRFAYMIACRGGVNWIEMPSMMLS